MTRERRSRRRSRARDLGLPIELLDAVGPVIAATEMPKPRPPAHQSPACCRATAVEQHLMGGTVVLLRRHEARCPVWSAR